MIPRVLRFPPRKRFGRYLPRIWRAPAVGVAWLAVLVAVGLPLIAQVEGTASDQSEVVKLDPLNVTAPLGRYAEVASSAATRTSTDMMDLPYSVDVLNASLLTDLRATRLGDAYVYLTGVKPTGAATSTVGIRGFDSTAVGGGPIASIQFDGLPGVTSRTGTPPSTVDVERIEVVKGPASVFYGQGNPGGLINIVSKSPSARRQASFEAYVSTYGEKTSGFGDRLSWVATLDSTGPIDAAGHWLYRVVASYERLDSFRDYGFQHDRYFFPSLTYRWNARTWLTIKAQNSVENKHEDDGLAVPYTNAALLPPINVTYQPPDARQPDIGDAFSLEFHHEWANRMVLRVNTRSVWHTDTFDSLETGSQKITEAVPYTDSTITPGFRFQETARRSHYLDANVATTWGRENFAQTVIVGVNGGKEFIGINNLTKGPNVNPVSLYHSVPDVAMLAAFPPAILSSQSYPQTNYWNYGAYVSDQFKLGSGWTGILAVRHDEQDASQTDRITSRRFKVVEVKDLIPSVGLVFHPRAGLSVYADYSEGFKPQGLGNVAPDGDPRFPAQSSAQIEAGVKVEALEHRLSASFAAYDIELQNVLEKTGQTTPAGLPIANLSGLQESQGIEFNLTYQPLPNWEVRAGYTYIDARVKASNAATSVGALLTNVPHNSGSLWTRYNVVYGPFAGLGLGLGANYVGNRAGIITNVPTNYFVLPGYARVDAGLYRRWGRLDCALNVGNLFDRTFISGVIPGTATQIFPGSPRKFTFSVKVGF